MAAYCTVQQFLQRKDARDIGDLVTDDGTPVPASALQSNQNVLTALLDASGDVDAALLNRGKYTREDLENLTGNAAEYLRRIVAEIAMYYLMARRPAANPDGFDLYLKMREQYLDSLRRGDDVFGLDKEIEASQAQVDGPSFLDYQQLNRLPDIVSNYYPQRQTPRNR